MERKDYYSILGLDRNADEQEIRAAYRRLAFRYHPDRNKEDPIATEKMKEINEAYAILSDTAKRREYDSLKAQYGDSAYARYRQAHPPEDIFKGSDIADVFQEFARQFGFRGFEDIYVEFYSPGQGSHQFRSTQRRSGDSVSSWSTGTGNAQGNAVFQSPSGGLGARLLKFLLKRMTGIELPERGRDWSDRITVNPKLALEGGEIEYVHKKRGGHKRLMVTIPAGTSDGQRIRLKGMGAMGKGGGAPGDLYLRVRIRTRFSQRLRNALKQLK